MGDDDGSKEALKAAQKAVASSEKMVDAMKKADTATKAVGDALMARMNAESERLARDADDLQHGRPLRSRVKAGKVTEKKGVFGRIKGWLGRK